jgi:hypothetical protein
MLLQFLCDQYYCASPEVHITKPQDDKKYPYIPSHLYHMCFELFKNSMRATVETFGDEALPPISVTIMAGKEDLTVKVWAALLRILRKGLASATRFGLACTLSALFERDTP